MDFSIFISWSEVKIEIFNWIFCKIYYLIENFVLPKFLIFPRDKKKSFWICAFSKLLATIFKFLDYILYNNTI